MAERNLDFDKITDRRNTNCLKYDFAVKRGMPEDVLPLWVADMDFQTSSYVQDALIKQVQHGIFGYSDGQESYFEAVKGWLKKHHDWEVQENWLVKTPGIVMALALSVKAYTDPEDAVLIQSPVYYPFSEVISDNGRKIVSSDLFLGEDNRYHIDFADFEKKIVEEGVKLFFLCNPHNPVGRVWKREELEQIGEICIKNNVTIISDEIHCELVYPGYFYTPFASISDDFLKSSVTCISPSKAFNIAGLQIANIVCADESIKSKIDRAINDNEVCDVNPFGVIATQAAYNEGEEWLTQLIDYLHNNYCYMKAFCQENLPMYPIATLEGTYLVWMDCRAIGLSSEKLEQKLIDKAKLWFNAGTIYGTDGEGFMRWNIACPHSTLKVGLKRFTDFIHKLT